MTEQRVSDKSNYLDQFFLVISCTAENQTGQCISASACTGKTVSGLCPGAADIKCCIGAAAAGPPCSVNGRPGVCRDKATCGGTTYSGLCPGAANIQCCITN